MDSKHAIVFVIFGLYLTRGTNGSCYQKAASQCQDILEVDINSLTFWNSSQLKLACGSSDKFLACYANNTGKCNDKYVRDDRGIHQKFLNYICGKGRELYLKTRDCMTGVDVVFKLGQCFPDLADSSHTKNDVCNKIIDYTSCAHEAVSTCGDDAKQYIGGYVKDVIYGLDDCDGTNNYCGQSLELQQCMTILQVHRDDTSLNRAQLDNLCRLSDKLLTCYDDFLERCKVTHLTNSRNELSRNFNYICGKGRELYLKTRVCMSQVNVSRRLFQCIGSDYVQSNVTKNTTCNNIDKLLNCSQKAVSSCGEDAEKYIADYVTLVQCGIKDSGGLIDSDGLNTGAIIGIVFGVLVVAGVLIAVVFWVLKKKSNEQSQDMDLRNNGYDDD